MHILETVYFTVVFILRSIHEKANFTGTISKYIYMVIRTLTSWIERIVYQCLYNIGCHCRFDENLLKANCAFCALILVYVTVTYYNVFF